jgi:hypothetical protein
MPYALKSMQKKAWEISEKSKEERTWVQALSLAKECVAKIIVISR